MAIIRTKPKTETHASIQAEALILTHNETAKHYQCKEISQRDIARLVWKTFHLGASHQREISNSVIDGK